jgi:FHS family L-fucose permease-like MFS transporter
MRLRTVPIFLTFFVMGVADAMGPMAEAVRTSFRLSNVVSTLLPFFVFVAFAVFSVPAGVLAARAGKKRVLAVGLAISAAAVLVPALRAPSFALLLACIFALGVGTTFLQVAGNPIMREVSPAGAYPRNLTLAQFVKGAGSASSSYLVGLAALLPGLGALGWRSPFPVFGVLMLVALAAVLGLRIDEARDAEPPGFADSARLLGVPAVALAVLGIFLYVGAEVCLARFLQPTLAGFGLSPDRAALLGPTLFFAGLTVGRLLGGAVLTRVAPRAFLRASALLGLLGALALTAHSRTLTLAGVVVCGLGFANIWPLLFSITVEERPERGAELSGLMCMAIAGGAVLPIFMGRLLDQGMGSAAYLVPAASFVYLLGLALRPREEADAALR